MKLEIGQTVWIIRKDHRAKYNPGPQETKITKVGRKWFEVDATRQNVFDVQTGKQKPTVYMDSFFVYFSKEAYETEIKEAEDRAVFKNLISNPRIPIEKVRAIIMLLQMP